MATIGIYYWDTAKEMFESIESMLSAGDMTNGEYYLSSVIVQQVNTPASTVTPARLAAAMTLWSTEKDSKLSYFEVDPYTSKVTGINVLSWRLPPQCF